MLILLRRVKYHSLTMQKILLSLKLLSLVILIAGLDLIYSQVVGKLSEPKADLWFEQLR
jgi:hypothetical protein